MSSADPQASISSLVTVVESLRAELAECKGEVQALKQRVVVLEEERRNFGFDLVSEAAEPAPPAYTTSAIVAGEGELALFRVEASEEIGRWIRRGLRGEYRGLSGREKIPQANQYYLVVKDFSGRVHDPPLFFRAWSSAKPYCQQSGQFGDSIFVGLPSQAEVRIAVRAAGLDLPAALLRR